MYKRGQLTAFILVGLVLILLTSIFFLLPNNKEEVAIEDLNTEKQILESTIKYCFDDISHKSIFLLAAQGGFIFDPIFLPTLSIDNLHIPYYVMHNQTSYPDIRFMEEASLKNYFDLEMLKCVNIDFPFENSISDPIITTSITDTISVSMEYKYNITKLDSKLSNEIFLNYNPICDLIDMYDIAKEMSQQELNQPGFVDLTYIDSMTKNGYNVTIVPYSDFAYITMITSDKCVIKDEYPNFIFALGDIE